MKKFLFIIVLISPIIVKAQLKINGYGIQQLGFEANPLRTPPAILEDEEEEIDFLEPNPRPFVSFSKIYLRASQKWKNSELIIRPRSSFYFFPELPEANYFRADIEQQFKFKINRKWRVFEKAFIGTRLRSGDQWDEEIFSFPRSYHRLSIAFGGEYRPEKNWTIYMSGGYIFQRFLDPEREVNQYNAFEIEGEVRRKYPQNGILKQISVNTQLQPRNWQRSVEIDSLEEIDLQTIQMLNWRSKWSATLVINEALDIKPFIQLSGRNSSRSSQNWISYGGGVQVDWEKDNFILKWTGNLSRRRFSRYEPENFEDQTLVYSYLSNNFSLEYLFTEKTSLLIQLRSIHRRSNFQEELDLSFGAYSNTFAGLGVKIRF